jgi:DNA modification methylase
VSPRVEDRDFVLYEGDVLDVLAVLPDGSVDCVVTSPPYLDARPEYDGPTVSDYELIFGQLDRVVTGPMLWNVGRIWRGGVEQLWWTGLIGAAAVSGWEHWDTQVWIKPNANPIRGRVFTDSHEYILVFGRGGVQLNVDAVRGPYAPGSAARLRRKWVNQTGVKNGADRGRIGEPHPLGARPPSYVEVYTGGEKGNPHPCPMPEDLADHLVRLASWPGQVVLDPFAGSGTTNYVARKHGRRSIGIELSRQYADLAAQRMQQQSLEFI